MTVAMRRTMTGLCLALTLLIAGCVLMPGRFTSDLALRDDGTFTFRYRGEIVMLALSGMGRSVMPDTKDQQVEVFSFEACHDAATGNDRACTQAELEKQRQQWEATQQARQRGRKDEAGKLQALLGGLDPGDPKASQEFVRLLLRQEGWKSVIDKGNGRFQVDYEITSRLTHDFVFPVVERVPTVPFVALYRRSDGTVRIDAPAFAAGTPGFPLGGMAGAMGAAAPGSNDRGKSLQDMPILDGTFTLATSGTILANNTDEGPQPDPSGGQRLVWKVNARTTTPPTALVRLAHRAEHN